jgi:hypothetical protein
MSELDYDVAWWDGYSHGLAACTPDAVAEKAAKLEDKLAAAEKDLEFFRQLAESRRQTSEEFRRIGEGWFREKERYRQALEKYGHHLPDFRCGQVYVSRPPCTCGYEDALSRPEQEEVRGTEEGKKP